MRPRTPSAPTSAKEMKRSGSSAAEDLVQQQPGELRQHQRIQLALAGHARAEPRRDFRARAAARALLSTRSSRILKPWPVRPACQLLEQRARQHEEAAHRVGQPHRQERLRQPDATVRQRVARSGRPGPRCRRPRHARLPTARSQRPTCRRASIAGSRLSSCCRSPSITATIVGGRRQRALDHRRGQAAAADAADAAHPRIVRGRCGAPRAAVPSGLLSST